MSEALISHLDQDEARVPTPPEGPPRTPVGTGSIHHANSRRSNFLSSLVPQWHSLMVGEYGDVFSLCDYTSNMKVHMVVFQLKGSALLWWKRLLPQMNIVVEEV
jgi:hypothetical protein